MRPKGMEDLAAFSAREVKRVAAEERERHEYSSAEEQWESKNEAKPSQRAFWKLKEGGCSLGRKTGERGTDRRIGRWSEPRSWSTSQEQEKAREEGAKEKSGEERLPGERWRRVGVSGSLRGRRFEEMTQSNTSSWGGWKYLLSPRGGDGNWSPQEWRDFRRREEWREKEVGSAIRWGGADRWGIHIKKRERGGVIKRDVDPYIIRVRIKRRKREGRKFRERFALPDENDNASLACAVSEERMPDREWAQSERWADNPGIRKEEDELRLDSWMQIRSTGWDERK